MVAVGTATVVSTVNAGSAKVVVAPVEVAVNVIPQL